jgi:uncharacterized protein (TIGR00369 family)
MEDNEPSVLLRTMLQRAVGDGRQEFGSFFLSRLLGFDVSYEGERCVVAFETIAPLLNPQGTLHGGILATALDVPMRHLLYHVAGAGTTLEIKVQYLASVSRGQVRCEGSFLRRGRSISFLKSQARAEDGCLLAHATATWKHLRSPDPERGRSPCPGIVNLSDVKLRKTISREGVERHPGTCVHVCCRQI